MYSPILKLIKFFLNNANCIDNKRHDFTFVGYMVVSDKLEEPSKRVAVTGGTAGGWPRVKTPIRSPAKIEVLQCNKCGEVIFKPAVFGSIFT